MTRPKVPNPKEVKTNLSKAVEQRKHKVPAFHVEQGSGSQDRRKGQPVKLRKSRFSLSFRSRSRGRRIRSFLFSRGYMQMLLPPLQDQRDSPAFSQLLCLFSPLQQGGRLAVPTPISPGQGRASPNPACGCPKGAVSRETYPPGKASLLPPSRAPSKLFFPHQISPAPPQGRGRLLSALIPPLV